MEKVTKPLKTLRRKRRQWLYTTLRRFPRAARVYLAVQRTQRRIANWWLHNLKTYGNWWRLANVTLAALLLFVAVLPMIEIVLTARAYALSDATQQLVGSADTTLASQLSYQASTGTYEFNQSSVNSNNPDNPASLLNKTGSTGTNSSNKSTYALSIPQTFNKGVTYTDSNSGLSFTMTPQFNGLNGKQEDGHLVFPLSGGKQAIYTLKDNGLKEDIVVPQVTQGNLSFSYTVNLPKTLAMRIIPGSGGEIGVYSADPSLYGNIQYGTSSDKAAVEKARENSPKNYLVFGLPAPVVKTLQGDVAGQSHFALNGNTLTVEVSGLSGVKGPVTIDPSVVVNSTTSFQTNGNNEGMISFNTSGQVTRGSLTGGSIGSWTTGSTLTSTSGVASGASGGAESASYNGYLYMVGLTNGSSNTVVDYAAIGSGGAIGTWSTTTSLPSGLLSTTVETYNGYMYVVGGENNGNSVATAYYAPINSNGTLGAWSTTSSLPAATNAGAGAVYDGYMHLISGWSNSTNTTAAYYAPINANGTLGTWQTTTSTPAASGYGAVAYNGYIYIANSSGNGTYHAPLGSNGAIGTWVTDGTSSALIVPTAVYNGYLYSVGSYSAGGNSSGVSYAPLYANGAVGSWQQTTSLSAATEWLGAAVYNGYVYTMGGDNGSSALNTTAYAQINPPGSTTSFTTSGTTYTTTRLGGQTVVNNGYIYEFGGSAGSTPVSTVYMASLSSNGTIGTWSTTTSMSASLQFFNATAYNGYMYVIGGCKSTLSSCTTSTNDVATVYIAAISSSGGTLGSWSAETSIPKALYGLNAVAYDGTMYVMGGVNGSTFSKTVYYQSFGTNGVLTGSWSTSSKTLAAANAYFGAVAYGGSIYVAGGCTAGATTCTTTTATVQYAKLTNTSGTAGDLSASFTTTGNSSFTNARGMLGMVVTNGYLYIMGGRNNTTYYSDTQYAPLNSNGTVGSWTTSPGTLSSTRYGIGAAVANGTIYVTGGYNGSTYYSDTQYAQINNGGNGAVNSWTSSSNTFNGDRFGLASVVADGYLYILGGCPDGSPGSCSSNPDNDIQYAQLNSDGSLGTWQTATNTFATARYGFSAAVYNGYMYIMGGNANGTFMNDVQYAPINSSTGAPGAWATTTSFATGRSFLAGAVSNGYLYIMGGNANGTFMNDVQYAPINSNGTVGTWTTNSTSFTTGRYGPSAGAYDGYLYVLGGCTSGGCSTFENDVQYAPINSNGSIGTWNETTSFVTARDAATVAMYNGYMYIMGGYSGNVLNDVQYAPINSNGTVGTWSETTALPVDAEGAAMAVANGYLYVSGGYNSPNYYNTTYYAPVSSIARIGHYSKLINLGGAYNITGFTDSGVVPNASSNITYTSAGTNGQLGSPALIGSIGNPGASCTVTSSSVQYVWVNVILDDSTGIGSGGTFPDVSDTPANLTNMTLTYAGHPAPQTRLRSGQTLQTGTLSPLDTCGA